MPAPRGVADRTKASRICFSAHTLKPAIRQKGNTFTLGRPRRGRSVTQSQNARSLPAPPARVATRGEEQTLGNRRAAPPPQGTGKKIFADVGRQARRPIFGRHFSRGFSNCSPRPRHFSLLRLWGCEATHDTALPETKTKTKTQITKAGMFPERCPSSFFTFHLPLRNEPSAFSSQFSHRVRTPTLARPSMRARADLRHFRQHLATSAEQRNDLKAGVKIVDVRIRVRRFLLLTPVLRCCFSLFALLQEVFLGAVGGAFGATVRVVGARGEEVTAREWPIGSAKSRV